jgi:hypothetical protein
MSSTDELAAIPIFSSLSEADLRELVTWLDVQTVSEGVRLTGEGAAGYSFFVLAQGSGESDAGARRSIALVSTAFTTPLPR